MSSTPARDGLLPLDKPVGPTSHDMVALARRALNVRRIGHTGTLDPFASGLLLLCVGRSTRLAEYLGAFPKEYVARVRLGERTATDDPEGEVLARSEGWTELDPPALAAALEAFRGDSEQMPPAYSAKKVKGRTAYSLARRGEEVRLSPSRIVVHEIHLEDVQLPEFEFRVRCSTGTYVRALARDMGERLGVGAHLTRLRRSAVGPFRVEGALTPDELSDPAAVARAWIPPVEAVPHLPRVEVGAAAALRLEAGQAVSAVEHGAPDGDGEMAVTMGDRLLAVAVREGDRLRPRKVFPRG